MITLCIFNIFAIIKLHNKHFNQGGKNVDNNIKINQHSMKLKNVIR